MRLVPLLLVAALAGPGAAASARAAENEDGRRLPFISDDYARGLGEARARSLPLFIEAWAPW